eukprot:7043616-Alexandrium_andersonii.AAC.1
MSSTIIGFATAAPAIASAVLSIETVSDAGMAPRGPALLVLKAEAAHLTKTVATKYPVQPRALPFGPLAAASRE